jgi:hypothetical protein
MSGEWSEVKLEEVPELNDATDQGTPASRPQGIER